MKSPRPKNTHRFYLLAALFFSLVLPPKVASADVGVVRVGGTGMALAAMRQLGDSLTAFDPSLRVEVLPSLGTPGGLRALDERAIDVAVVGRPLKAEEKAKGAAEAACMNTALVFASSHPAPSGLNQADLPGVYANASPTWPDGQALKVLLRARAGSENGYLAAAMPGMAAALESAYARPGVPVATTDQDNAELALQTAGSFAIMTLLQVRSERLDLRVLALDGVAPSTDALANKTYPMPVRICVVLPADPAPEATKFVAHLRSDTGRALLERLGATVSP
jgi:phosphate transport system substrate-binding protein